MVEGPAETNETVYYTLEEVAQHNGKINPDVWFIYRDAVYDVTEYLDQHPGGGELITEWAGKDATKEFDDVGHSRDSKRELKLYKIGEVVEEQRKVKTKKTEDKQTSKQEKAKEAGDTFVRRSCISIVTCGLCG